MYFPNGITIQAIAALSGIGTTGINCKGSGLCSAFSDSTLTELHDKIIALNPSQTFSNGQHIVCKKQALTSICCFVQNLQGTITADQAANSVAGLLSHGCKVCGSNPLDGGDGSRGQITCNAVA